MSMQAYRNERWWSIHELRFSKPVVWAGMLLLLAFGPALSLARQPIRLADAPALSPDGSQLAFAWQGDVWLVPSEGGSAARLTMDPADDGDPVFSPDGKQIAFTSNRSGSRQLYVVPAAGGAATQLTFHADGCSLQDWFPDGKSLLISASRDHFWRRADRFFRVSTEPQSGEQLLFDDYGYDGRVSPDGRRIAFRREGTQWWRKGYRGSQAAQIWLYDLEAKSFEQVLNHESGCRHPLWSADSNKLYFVSGQSGSFNLWFHNLASSESRQLTEFEDDSVVMPCISRDGSTVVFRHLFDFYRMNPNDDSEPQRLEIFYDGDEAPQDTLRRTLRSATEVAFSSDGLEVAFIAGGDVWVMDTVFREPRQITHTSEEERDLVFSPDGRQVVFVSDAEGQSDIWTATRSDEDKYWWQNDQFVLKRLTNDPQMEMRLAYSPTGEHLAYLKERGDLWIIKPDGKQPKQILASWNEPQYDWSPDGKWLVYAVSDSDFNRDVHILPIDGSREAYNISRHPDNDTNPVWSPDGKAIAFTGRRFGSEVDIYYLYLQTEEDEQEARDRKLKEALEKLNKARKKPSASTKSDQPPENRNPSSDEPDKSDGEADDESKDESAEKGGDDDKKTGEKKIPEVIIDFDGLADRLRRVSIPDTSEGNLFWSPDSKKLAFAASIDGKSGTYTISPPDDVSPKLLSSQVGGQPRWLEKGNLIVWLAGGVPSSLSAQGAATAYSFTALQQLNQRERFAAAFLQSWRAMRDNFYDENLNNRNWDQIYRKYSEMARESRDESMLAEVVNLMLGELNGSHLGFSATGGRSRSPDVGDWQENTAHFGVRFDPQHQGPGLKVRDVIHDSPASQQRSKIEPGEIILSINGKAVDPAMDLSTVLNGRLDRDFVLQVRDQDEKQREVVIRPISYGQARSLLYEHWVQANRDAVSAASDGRLAYLHIRGMNMSSFYRFEEELFAVAFGKDGIVIDVRENGGGSTTDHLLTILTQPVHAITVPRGGERGYPHDRKVYASWHKPVIVLCNQNSFSNAEIFSHAIKTLQRGKLVGVPTAGGVISTGGTRIMDIGFLRMPFRGWYLLNDGEDMELHGAAPDFVIWPEPTEMPAGNDRQLDKAIEVLLEEVEQWKNRPQPKLIKASERTD